jgi:hypothetical protein
MSKAEAVGASSKIAPHVDGCGGAPSSRASHGATERYGSGVSNRYTAQRVVASLERMRVRSRDG